MKHSFKIWPPKPLIQDVGRILLHTTIKAVYCKMLISNIHTTIPARGIEFGISPLSGRALKLAAETAKTEAFRNLQMVNQIGGRYFVFRQDNMRPKLYFQESKARKLTSMKVDKPTL